MPKQINHTTNKNTEPFVQFTAIEKSYPSAQGSTVVVENFNLNIKKGEFVSLIGHSGCGKSTILSIVAGLIKQNKGLIFLDQKEIQGPDTDRGIVFQSPSLFPWMTALQNVLAAVQQGQRKENQKKSRDKNKLLAIQYLKNLGLGLALDKYPRALSQGMQQRVGIARAFALAPKLLLLDEPFGMLDSITKAELQDVLIKVWEETHLTALMVTHDIDEAILLSDRVVMMTNGPHATVGGIIEINLPRPRWRKEIMDQGQFDQYREEILTFLRLEDNKHK